jgi:hypothetical protein
MFYIKGLIRDDKQEDFSRKDGTVGRKRTLFIEPEGNIFSEKVDFPLDEKAGKVGDKVDMKVNIYPYYFLDGVRKRAYLSIYVKPQVDKK